MTRKKVIALTFTLKSGWRRPILWFGLCSRQFYLFLSWLRYIHVSRTLCGSNVQCMMEERSLYNRFEQKFFCTLSRPFLLEGPLQRENRDLTIRQRWPRWKRRWEIGFAFFRFFSLLFQWTQLLKRRECWLELKRRDRAWVLTEMVEFIALQFPFPSKLKIGSFHVLVMQGR